MVFPIVPVVSIIVYEATKFVAKKTLAFFDPEYGVMWTEQTQLRTDYLNKRYAGIKAMREARKARNLLKISEHQGKLHPAKA